MPLLCHNGRFADTLDPVLAGDNPSFKWGEGLFETMRMAAGEIPLMHLHWARLQQGLTRLGMNDAALQRSVLENILRELALRNECAAAGRLRLHLYREGAGLGFVAEAAPLAAADHGWNERGWSIEVFADARIAPDAYSSLKRANYLPYLLAARRAADTGVDECFLLNAQGNVCDAARGNVFVVRGGIVQTPPLSEGAIDGVLRRHLMSLLAAAGRPVQELGLTMEDLLEAEELFITNAVKGIRWVARFRQRTYAHAVCKELYGLLGQPFNNALVAP
ncbi:MAG: hypothetical protein EOO08_11900 [Chitinophagaceae bacterium]|nr:MAG: hypothetical protein EOO08_11900 [Chitinophagaceae bacterium]